MQNLKFLYNLINLLHCLKAGDSSSDDNIVLISGEADSFFSALTLLNTYIGKEINLAHCNVFVFSEEIAKEGISELVYGLINNEEARPSATLLVSKCSAYDYLDNTTPNLEKLTTQYYDTFAITSRFTGYIEDTTIGDFFNTFSEDSCDAIAILGGLNSSSDSEQSSQSESSSSESGQSEASQDDSSQSESSQSESSSQSETETNIETNPDSLIAGTSSIEGDRKVENFGLALFKGDKYCGELTASETFCHLLISNRVASSIISIDNPLKEGSKLELEIIPEKKSKTTTTIDNDKLSINIDFYLSADILTLDYDTNYEDDEILQKISDATSSYLTDELNNYLKKVSNEYNVDIDKFCLTSLKYFATQQDFDDFNWNEKYKDAEFNVNVNIDLITTLLITKT